MKARNYKRLFDNGFLLATKRKEAKICQTKQILVLRSPITCRATLPGRLYPTRCLIPSCGLIGSCGSNSSELENATLLHGTYACATAAIVLTGAVETPLP